MEKGNKGLVFVNAAVLLFGFSGILAQKISFSPLMIAFGRSLLSSLMIFLFARTVKISLSLRAKKSLFEFILSGAALAVHWWAFAASTKLASVAISAITFSTFPLFVIFLEPFVMKCRISLKNIFLSLLIIFGVLITFPGFDFHDTYVVGILVGMLSSFTYACMTIMNKRQSSMYEGIVITFYNHSFACLFLSFSLLSFDFRIERSALIYLVLLGLFSTASAHCLYNTSLKFLKASVAGVISSLETVYAIIFAIPICGQIPTLREIAGGFVILAVVFYIEVSSVKTSKNLKV